MMNDTRNVVVRYFDAWNSHNGYAIISSFIDGGVYQDPIMTVQGEAIALYAQDLWTAFPDLYIEIINKFQAEQGDAIAIEWLMTGTNTGPINGLSPTGKSIAVAGADIIKIVGNKISSVNGYFDSYALPKQLGLQLLVQTESN